MRSLIAFFVLLGFMASSALVQAQGAEPANPAGGSTSVAATKAEVDQLRGEVAAQRQTIEELKALVEKLAEAKTSAADSGSPQIHPVADSSSADANLQPVAAPGYGSAHLTNAVLLEATPEPAAVLSQTPAAAPKKDAPPLTAGWNGEHFFIRSADGQFSISPYGYLDTDYRAYKGDGAPSDSFLIRRARFGFQGNYGSHFDFAILTDSNATNGAIVRDAYLNVRIRPEFQFQAGQFKEPFAQETGIGATNLDFVERGLQSLLYPSAGSAFRSPGLVIHGDLDGGVMQYWGGIFDGKGYTGVSNTTSVPESIGRVRFYPFRKHKGSLFEAFAFGGSIAYSYSRGLSNEVTPRMLLPDGSYTFFPQFPINGNVWRYEGEFTYLHGPWGFRDEYVQAMFDRTGVGTLQFGGLGFQNLPTVRFRGWNSSATYLLTGERRPENGTPRVKHPVFGPETPGSSGKGWGAWELGFRYSGLEGKEPGIFFDNVYTPENVPGFNQKTDQFSAGLNWYLNYWVRYQTTVDVDRLRDPSTIGAVPQTYLVFEQRIQFRF